ncbi:MAG TPA: hypothetical protein VEY30_08900, partial [Myxococcaceae bacterium]|nr:hypothetical protein [Myxococcaceae bacterium]
GVRGPMNRALFPAMVVVAAHLTACTGRAVSETATLPPGSSSPPGSAEENTLIGGEEALRYARRVAPMLVGRTLQPGELERLTVGGGDALVPTLEAWIREPGFAEAARTLISTKLKASGKRGELDLDLPGNLAAELARSGRPYAEILTAPACVDAGGQEIACDTGAPYAAGVLGTRAFLANNAGRFNLKRARTVMNTFACLEYPMDPSIQPPLAREVLIPLFQQDQVPQGDGSGAFGNGFACYACHSQFGAHAQPFVKFDADGVWTEDATGQQDPDGEPGRSLGKLFTSHMLQAGAAQSEASQVFGRRVGNLAEAARSIAESDRFLPCAVRTLLGFGFSLPESIANGLPDAAVNEIVAAARAREPHPSLGALAVEAFSHPAVVRSLRTSDE